MSEEHTVLVAFTVNALSREAAETWLTGSLPRPDGIIDSWWIAEDDRHDGSDNDSAVFVPMGSQQSASEFLNSVGRTPAHNVVQR